MTQLNTIYQKLRACHGRQGWWPIIKNGSGIYHSNAPNNSREIFEIIIGAILTQGISWNNVVTAIFQLKRNKLLTPRKLLLLPDQELAVFIRSTGYYNQKVIKIKEFMHWFRQYSYSPAKLASLELAQLRNDLMSIKGIGPETADSILLYALRKKIFVIDAFTKRIFARIGIMQENASYEQFQNLCHNNFNGDINDYNEFHALIVAHGKICKKTIPLCEKCPLQKQCDYFKIQNKI